jgi:hypothetical protein
MRRIEAIRDRIMQRIGTSEPLIELEGMELLAVKQTRQWRKPLSVEEINRMAPTPEVLERRGRP